MHERIFVAGKIIVDAAVAQINDKDTILVFSFSSLLEAVLSSAAKQTNRFRVIVVDTRPKFEGRKLLQRLVSLGVDVQYVMLTALGFVMG